MATHTDTDQSRITEARRALAGEERYVALAKKETDTAHRRREAMRAMEGEGHRRRREDKEKTVRQRQVGAEALAKQEQAAKEAATKLTAKRMAKEHAKQEASTKTQQERLIKITDKERTIEEIKQSMGGLSPIRTYKSDFASAVKQGGMSIAKIAMSEQARRFHLGKVEPSEATPRGQAKIFVWLVTLILLAAVATLGYLAWNNSQNPVTVEPGLTPPTPLIFAENNVHVTLDQPADTTTEINAKSLIDAATAKIATREPSISNFYFVKDGATLNLNSFSREAGLKLPERLARNVKPEFMFGAYNDGRNQSRFLILNVGAFDQVYAAALEWEGSLAADVLPLLDSSQRVNQVTGRRFTDKRIRNADIRLIADAAGQTFLLYTFLDQNTLLITTSEDTFVKVLDRFTNN